MEHRIERITARQILDSRGMPTVSAEVRLTTGVCGWAAVPSGASTGANEACELRDGDKAYSGKGVLKAVEHVNQHIDKRLRGQLVFEQRRLDQAMIDLDGTKNKSNLGANAILAVSLALAHAGAKALSMPLFRYLGGVNAQVLPVPMMNILNGGAHADNNIDIQEFMVRPVGAKNFHEALRMGTEVYMALGKLLKEKGMSRSLGDEGGYAPNLEGDEQALKLLVEAILRAGYVPKEQVSIALDVAATEWRDGDAYKLPKRGKYYTRSQLIEYYEKLTQNYPIDSIEDPFSEEDFEGFAELTRKLSAKGVQVVGDDLFTTNPERLEKGIQCGAGNAILVKPNQIGTLTETMTAVRMAQRAGFRAILSHRSGETEDSSIADIAVALNAGQIKTGAPARSDRTAKYNRLLAIEDEIG